MATRKSTTRRKAKPSVSTDHAETGTPKTLNAYIDEQRNQVFHAQAIIGTVRQAIWSHDDGESDRRLVDSWGALDVAHELLENIGTKLDSIYIEDPGMERTVNKEAQP